MGPTALILEIEAKHARPTVVLCLFRMRQGVLPTGEMRRCFNTRVSASECVAARLRGAEWRKGVVFNHIAAQAKTQPQRPPLRVN